MRIRLRMWKTDWDKKDRLSSAVRDTEGNLSRTAETIAAGYGRSREWKRQGHHPEEPDDFMGPFGRLV